MANLTYTVQVDWNLDGLWTGTGEDVTSRVLRMTWRRGKDRPHYLAGRPQPGMCRIILNNESGDYSPQNSSSPLTGNLKAGRPVRIISNNGGANTVRWQGFIKSIDPFVAVNNIKTVVLNCVGPLGYIQDREVEAAMQTSYRTDQAVADLLDAAGWFRDYADEVAADTPAGYWRLGETSGNALDTSGNGNDGTVTSATQGESGLLGDDANGSYEFDGTDDDITVTDDAAIQDIFASGGVVEAWINADSDGENSIGTIIDKRPGWVLFTFAESGGAMKLGFIATFSGDDGDWSSTNTVLTVGQTHHVAIHYDGGSTAFDPTLFVDGVVVAITETTAPTGTFTSDAGNNLVIGNNVAHTGCFDGHIDEVAIYNTTLTPERVRAHRFAGVQQWRSLDTGDTTMNRWWADRMPVLEALRIVEETEFGQLYETKDGKIAFKNRQSRFGNRTSQATFSDAAAAALTYQGIREGDSDRDIYNIAEAEVQLFTVGGVATLWVFPETTVPYLAPRETLVFWARYPVNDSPVQDVGVDAWTTPDETFPDYQANSLEAGGGTDISTSMTVAVEKFGESMKISITNDHATLPAYLVDSGGTIVLQARGTAVSGSDPIPIRQEDTTSKATHGERTWQGRDLFLPDRTAALNWGGTVIDLYKDPHPQLSITVMGNRTSGTLDQVEARDLDDRITVRADGNAGLGINQDWYIEAERHTITDQFQHSVTWDLSDTTRTDLYWILGTSALGTDTKLGY